MLCIACVAHASTSHQHVCVYVHCTKKQSANSLLKMSLYTYFQKTSKSCLPNPQGPLSKQFPSFCFESSNNNVEVVTNATYSVHVCKKLWAERQRELSTRTRTEVMKSVAIMKFLSLNLRSLDLQQF